MFKVKDYMTKDVICTEKDATISEVLELMKEHGIHRVPVVENQKLVGLITEGMIATSHSSATSLSIYELNYLLSKTTVNTVMVKNVISMNEEELMESCAETMRTHDIGCIPITDEKNNVVGIVTQNDVFGCFLSVLGWEDKGTRITIAVKDELGAIGKLSDIFVQQKVNISHIGVYSFKDGIANMVVRCDAEDPKNLIQALEEHGYQVLETYKN
ncbi:CBS and ACT domain-containing protein [Faecalicoccus pleomorphus]|uniref:CBS and ACT domain-containing protein n=1 Tax=Faecalicoccus pleomorphus TaxID=1323 RepID=UPI00142F5984|nr:CBS and ACT domain-containing protein [Faecalicoccus pleomorphus]MBM6677850.1 CBS domain-containing protein [Faecalicoccus pleomorphus]MBM6765021.1 CBS domain-containing protein [Faecalicoccus pleomorphus]MDB7987363.1 CBS and ACT domain-containing protein [Faecalicoccus pleomorphus]MDB7991371.1 CBS and ACT domain-containing protein [Faecalicoccus pleomorphus]MDM8291897.1 CBS and ACT domain-containing protein [Faecalicoccus pleomorphus]